jgi:hypothetical protein
MGQRGLAIIALRRLHDITRGEGGLTPALRSIQPKLHTATRSPDVQGRVGKIRTSIRDSGLTTVFASPEVRTSCTTLGLGPWFGCA